MLWYEFLCLHRAAIADEPFPRAADNLRRLRSEPIVNADRRLALEAILHAGGFHSAAAFTASGFEELSAHLESRLNELLQQRDEDACDNEDDSDGANETSAAGARVRLLGALELLYGLSLTAIYLLRFADGSTYKF